MIPPGMIAKDFYLSSAAVSKIETCPASGVFLAAEREKKVEPWLWWGIFIHRFLEYAQSKGRQEALAYIEQKFPRGLSTCRRIDTDAIPAGDPEVALAHDVYERRGRRLHGFGQKPLVGSETYGRADLIFIDKSKDGRPHVVDYKTGDPTPDKTPVDNIQLLGLAAAVRDELGWTGPVDVSIVAVPGSGQLVWRTIEQPAEQLEQFTERSKKVHLQVMQSRRDMHERGVMPLFNVSDHCKWCNLKPHCPAHKQGLGEPHIIVEAVDV